MFKTLGFFSGTSCPNQDTCLLPRCIFLHSGNNEQDGVTEVAKVDINAGGNDQGGQRKRLKLSIKGESSIGSSVSQPSESKKSTGAEKIKGAPSSARTLENKRISTARSISPPPLRQSENGTPLQKLQSSTSNTKTAPQVKPTPVKAGPKKELLHPRTLERSPAPLVLRLKLLRALHEQYARLNSELAKDANDDEEALVLSDQEVITRALDLEAEAAIQPSIYSNVVKNKIMVHKRMTVSQWKEERAKEIARAKAESATNLSGTPKSRPTEPPKVIETGLKPEEEQALLPRLYTPINNLSQYGYVSTIPTQPEIEVANRGIEAAKGWEVCDRCKSRFQVFPGRREEDGALASGGPCTYHYGKPILSERSAVDPKSRRERKYSCCNQSIGDSPGCTKAENHVFKITEVKRLAAVCNFSITPENTSCMASEKPVCIDGEMGYTVNGLELIRLTATLWPNYEELLDVLVRPFGEILDLNSRYSGIWPKDMAEAIPWDPSSEMLPATNNIISAGKRKLRIVSSPAAARALLCSYLSPRTPLIGHGLENDLNATRLIHPTIIDTALLFPHKAGLPYRNGLKALMHTHLNRQIQVVVAGQIVGHDSKEDANAAGDLVRFQLCREWEKMQREGWLLKDGAFVPPGKKENKESEKVESDVKPYGSEFGMIGNGKILVGRKRNRTEVEVEDAEAGD